MSARRLRRRVTRWVRCKLGRHAWATHSTHMHFNLGRKASSVVETPCLYCRKRRYNVTTAVASGSHQGADPQC